MSPWNPRQRQDPVKSLRHQTVKSSPVTETNLECDNTTTKDVGVSDENLPRRKALGEIGTRHPLAARQDEKLLLRKTPG